MLRILRARAKGRFDVCRIELALEGLFESVECVSRQPFEDKRSQWQTAESATGIDMSRVLLEVERDEKAFGRTTELEIGSQDGALVHMLLGERFIVASPHDGADSQTVGLILNDIGAHLESEYPNQALFDNDEI